ncbi:hypothetical protein [Chryseoglobus sp. 28M-23]|uniref:hypothetical protein n=1 Tax=Chryseoglobus sp. 28M-23 TaxID=2772253 RepID=UPI001746F47B|nr:hypothetical protein [Chryseoglobus sp. 28M-23]QOD94648.1 hypothetical protein IE160_05530 [Chryseoglobus sp. 28M-23]
MTIAHAVPRAADSRVAAIVLALQALGTLVALGLTDARLDVLVLVEPPVLLGEGSAPLVTGVLLTPEAVRGMLAVLLATAVLQAFLVHRSARGALGASTASTAHWIAVSQSLGITVVIIALLNGAAAASTIILAYALAAAGGLLGWLQDRAPRLTQSRAHLWPYAFLTVLVIVPWGVIALVQITGLALGAPASDGVRVTTLVVLAATAAWAVAEWAIARPAGVARTPEGAARLRVISSTGLASVPAGAVLVLALLGG